MEGKVNEFQSNDGTDEDADVHKEERSEKDNVKDGRKRKSEHQLKKLMDNKRKHMQKHYQQLSVTSYC